MAIIKATLQEAFDMGYDAFNSNATRNDNPFDAKEDLMRHKWWGNGWTEAQAKDARDRINKRYGTD